MLNPRGYNGSATGLTIPLGPRSCKVVKLRRYRGGAQTGQARKQKVPESTITAIRERHSRGVPPEDAQIIDFTRDLINKHRVSDETMKALQKRFGNYQLVELTGTIGYYSLLAMTANATELEPAEGAEVLKT